jgi:hypothetical protein
MDDFTHIVCTNVDLAMSGDVAARLASDEIFREVTQRTVSARLTVSPIE